MRIGPHGEVDPGRYGRTGIPEGILADGKTDPHLTQLAQAMVGAAGWALVTRLPPERLHAVQGPYLVEYHQQARAAVLGVPPGPFGGRVLVLAAGTSDAAVAEEARVTAETCGCVTHHVYDVGVAGPHRLEAALEGLPWDPHAVIAVAGREAALPVVLAARVPWPVIGVPTSTGYGLGGQGVAALYGLLQSCSPLAVVNIDAGFVAGAFAAKIARAAVPSRQPEPEARHRA